MKVEKSRQNVTVYSWKEQLFLQLVKYLPWITERICLKIKGNSRLKTEVSMQSMHLVFTSVIFYLCNSWISIKMAVWREEYTDVYRRRETRWEENTLPIPCVEFCTERDIPMPSHPAPRTCLFPSQLPQSASVVMSQWDSPNPGAPSISQQAEVYLRNTQAPQKHQDPAANTAHEDRKSKHTWWFEGLHFTHACKPHGKRVTLLPGDKGLYNGQRGQKDRKCSSQCQGKKRAARRFYSSCQHPITNQQFALTTKLSKKRQRLGHSSNGLRRSQLSAQEKEKKPTTPAYHISPSYWSMTKKRIYGRRGQRGEKQKSIGSNRAWRKITSPIKRGYLPG